MVISETLDCSSSGVSLHLIVTFNRMKQLSTDLSVIVAALSASNIMEVTPSQWRLMAVGG